MLQVNENNLAFIDGQNLYSGTRTGGWAIDYARFRIYLSEKYKVGTAYYFLGYIKNTEQKLYSNLQNAGFTLVFKEHSSGHKGLKKGNVDSDIIFEIMKTLVDGKDFDRALIISGDGDYKKLVDYLIIKGKFARLLFPNEKFASTLYTSLGREYYDYLDTKDIREKIEYKSK